MKVRDIIKKYRLCSNADVFIQADGATFFQMTEEQLKEMNPETIMDATVTSIDVIDNVLTIHVR